MSTSYWGDTLYIIDEKTLMNLESVKDPLSQLIMELKLRDKDFEEFAMCYEYDEFDEWDEGDDVDVDLQDRFFKLVEKIREGFSKDTGLTLYIRYISESESMSELNEGGYWEVDGVTQLSENGKCLFDYLHQKSLVGCG